MSHKHEILRDSEFNRYNKRYNQETQQYNEDMSTFVVSKEKEHVYISL